MSRRALIVLFAAGICGVWILLAVLLLLYGNEWWLSGLTTLTIFVWLAGILAVVYQQGPARPVALGGVVAAFAYWLLALGPWFSINVGPTLLTSRVLRVVDVALHGEQPAPPQLWSTYPGQTGAAFYSNQVYTINTAPTPNTGPATVSFLAMSAGNLPGGVSSIFQAIGQWLTIWVCAALGGGVALLMHHRTQRKKRKAEGPSFIGESPFAPPQAPAATDSAEGSP